MKKKKGKKVETQEEGKKPTPKQERQIDELVESVNKLNEQLKEVNYSN
ncbi:MAG TPA: hypothetical protein PK357_03285 [Candidatus Pacearchaeota archaeon]|nr:hypothetical protein [Candidatus Pacearchaeota archaeon]